MSEREFYPVGTLQDATPTQDVEIQTHELSGEPVEFFNDEKEWGEKIGRIVNEIVDTASELCDGTNSGIRTTSELLELRSHNFVDTTSGEVKTDKVDEYLEKVYGIDSTNTLASLIDSATVNSTAFIDLLDSGGSPADKKAFIKDSVKLAIATGSPREVNSLLKNLNSGEINLLTGANNLTTAGKILITSTNNLGNNKYGTSNRTFKLKDEIKHHIEDPTNTTKKSAFTHYMSPPGGRSKAKLNVTSPGNTINTTSWICKVGGNNPDKGEKMFKGLLGDTGLLKDLKPSVRNIIEEEVGTFNKNPLSYLHTQIEAMSEISEIAKHATKKGNEKVKEIEDYLGNRDNKRKLGNLYETIDANVSIDNPKHKEVLARRALLDIEEAIKVKNNITLTDKTTPWNTSWEEEFRKAETSLNEDGNIMAAAELLGRLTVFGLNSRPNFRKEAYEKLNILLTSLLIHQGENKVDVLSKIKGVDPDNYGKEFKKYFTDSSTGNLRANPENSSVNLGMKIFSTLENIRHFQRLANKGSSRTEEEESQYQFLINRLHNNNASIFDIGKDIDPSTFNENQTEKLGDPLQELVQKDAVAEVLGLNQDDPEVQEIIKMSEPNNILETENRRFNRINQSENIRKASIAGITAVGVGLAFNPATAPVGTAILAGVGIARGYVVVKNIIESSKRIGFKKTMSNMWQGIKKSFTFMFDKERTKQEKMIYASTFLGGVGRFFLPGLGSALYAVAETGAIAASEIDLNSRKKKLALEIAELRVLMKNTNYTTSSNRSVNIKKVWDDYKVRRDLILEEERIQANRTGENMPPIDDYSDSAVLAYIEERNYTASSDANYETDFREAMKIIIQKQETIRAMNEKYNKASGLWGAAFAGTMVGSLVGGVAKIGVDIARQGATVRQTAQEEPRTYERPEREPFRERVPQDSADSSTIPTDTFSPTGTDIPERIYFDQFDRMKTGLEIRGMGQGMRSLVLGPLGGDAGVRQAQAVELLLKNGYTWNTLNTEKVGWLIGEIAYQPGAINVEKLQTALERASTIPGIN